MNSQIQSSQNESGADLFTRLISQKMTQSSATQNERNFTQLESALMINKFLNLDPHLFPTGLSNKEVVEIFGKVGLGKSELLMNFMARCLMPRTWILDLTKLSSDSVPVKNSVCVNLSEYSCHDQVDIPKVILIETESKFSMLRLYTILESRISSCLDKSDLNKEIFQTTQFQTLVKKFIRDRLKNLTVYRCSNSEQFILALCASELLIQSLIANNTINSVITPVFIDSVNANFEIGDKYNHSIGLGDYDHTEKYAVQLIKKLVDRYNICLIGTRLDLRISSNEYNSFKKWQSCLSKQIELRQEILVKNINQDSEELDGCDKAVQTKESHLKMVEFLKKNENRDVQIKVIKEKIRYLIKNEGFELLN